MWSLALCKDILNILWKNRNTPPMPPAPYPADQIVLRAYNASFTIQPYYTGDMVIKYYDEYGVYTENTFPAADSGTTKTIGVTQDTDIIITGNVTQLVIGNGIEFASVSNILQILALNLGSGVQELDLRNGDSLVGFGYSPYGILVLYAIANNAYQSGICDDIINNSPHGSTVWINDTQAEAATVIAAAEANLWTINRYE